MLFLSLVVSLALASSPKNAGVDTLSKYQKLFGHLHKLVDPFASRQQVVDTSNARKDLISADATGIYTQDSPLNSYELFVNEVHTLYPVYIPTEDCGRLLFPSLPLMRAVFKQHIIALGKGLDVPIMTILAEDDDGDFIDIDVETPMQQHDIESMAVAAEAGRWSQLSEFIALETSVVKAQKIFIEEHQTYFIVKPVDYHAAHGNVVSDIVRVVQGNDVTIAIYFDEITDDFKMEPHVDLSMKIEPKDVLGNVLSNIVKLAAPSVSVELIPICMSAERLLTVHELDLNDMENVWMNVSQIFNDLVAGVTTFNILNKQYVINTATVVEIQTECILTCLMNLQLDMSSSRELEITTLYKLSRLASRSHLLVNAAGDCAVYQCSSQNDLARVLAGSMNLINVVGLAEDGAHLIPISNQPGIGPLAKRTICALGVASNLTQDRSTTIAASYIAGCAASIKSSVPILTWSQVAQCLLDSASPIILVTNNASAPFDMPIVLDSILAKDFQPGLIFNNRAGKQPIYVSQEMFNQSRSKYGMGRVNMRSARKLARLSVEEFFFI